MIPWYWIIPAMIISAVFGFITLAFCVSSQKADDEQPRPKERKRG